MTQTMLWVSYWGMIYFSLVFVVTKLVTVFLSWLNEALAEEHIALVILVFILVGLFLFMNPSVPGSSIYLVGGVMIPKKISKDFGGGAGLNHLTK